VAASHISTAKHRLWPENTISAFDLLSFHRNKHLERCRLFLLGYLVVWSFPLWDEELPVNRPCVRLVCVDEPTRVLIVLETTVYLSVYGENLQFTLLDPPSVLVVVTALANLTVSKKCDNLCLIPFGIENKEKTTITQENPANPTGLEWPLEGPQDPREERKNGYNANARQDVKEHGTYRSAWINHVWVNHFPVLL